MVNVSVIGATGYAGAELMRLLAGHAGVRVRHAVSKSFAGRKLSSVYRSFAAHDFLLEAMNPEAVGNDSDVVFTCLPHGASADVVSGLRGGPRVIDLSADFRYKNADIYETWYGVPHTAKALLEASVYGLPELYREEIKAARLIGNPGCYTTCAILALYPLLKAGVIEPRDIIIDAKSGASGAGRSERTQLSFCEVGGSARAYGVAAHRHTSEIEQELSIAAGREVVVSFTPHLLPISRGIISTIYATPKAGAAEIADAYAAYESEPFTHVLADGLPEIRHVAGSNNCVIGFVPDSRANRLVVVSCLDNLIKGASGQAVQNLNLLCGYDEREGLSDIGWYL